MKRASGLSIKAKLTLLALLAGTTALVLAGVALALCKLLGSSVEQAGLRAGAGLVIAYALIVLFGTWAIASALAQRVEREIAKPILHLVKTACQIKEQNNYFIRAAKCPGDEIGLLTDEFNQMLDAIQQRDIAVSNARRRAEEASRRPRASSSPT